MKKLIAISLCLALVFSLFVGCSKDPSSDDASGSTATGKIDSMAEKGKLEGIKFGLGSDIEEVKAYYQDLAVKYEAEHGNDNHDHGVTGEEAHYYYLNDKETYTEIDISSARFYFEKGKEEKGISVIACDSDTFGFTVGVTTKYEVEDAVKAKGESFNATEAELRFLAVRTEPILVHRYEYENYVLDFYFYDNLLVTTVIKDTDNWKL